MVDFRETFGLLTLALLKDTTFSCYNFYAYLITYHTLCNNSMRLM